MAASTSPFGLIDERRVRIIAPVSAAAAGGSMQTGSDLEGGCLCGAVRYKVLAGEISESGYCHCRTCQKQSGAPVVAWFAVPPHRVRYIGGAAAKYRSSSRATREFCGACGTYLVFREDDAAATVSINTATLDEPALVPPEFHIYTESRIGWFKTADQLPRHKHGKG